MLLFNIAAVTTDEETTSLLLADCISYTHVGYAISLTYTATKLVKLLIGGEPVLPTLQYIPHSCSC